MKSEVVTLRLHTGISIPCIIRGLPGDPPLLLLHAWGESGRSFERILPLLAGFRAIAPDLRGQGGADQPDGGYALAEQADDAAAVLDALGIRQALVLGSSSGGYIAQQLAVSQPQRVAALVLAGSPLTLRGRPEFADDVDRLSDPIDSGWVRNSLAWFPLQRAVPQWFVEDRVADGVGMPARVWKLTLDGFCRAIPPTEVGTIPVPTLVLWGAHDGLVPRRDMETLAARIPRSVLTVYPDVGHLVLWEDPARVATDASAFFRSLDQP